MIEWRIREGWKDEYKEWERNKWMNKNGWKVLMNEWMKLSLDRIQTPPLPVIIKSFVGSFLNSASVVVLWPF